MSSKAGSVSMEGRRRDRNQGIDSNESKHFNVEKSVRLERSAMKKSKIRKRDIRNDSSQIPSYNYFQVVYHGGKTTEQTNGQTHTGTFR